VALLGDLPAGLSLPCPHPTERRRTMRWYIVHRTQFEPRGVPYIRAEFAEPMDVLKHDVVENPGSSSIVDQLERAHASGYGVFTAMMLEADPQLSAALTAWRADDDRVEVHEKAAEAIYNATKHLSAAVGDLSDGVSNLQAIGEHADDDPMCSAVLEVLPLVQEARAIIEPYKTDLPEWKPDQETAEEASV
jgi:hypothetical protein